MSDQELVWVTGFDGQGDPMFETHDGVKGTIPFSKAGPTRHERPATNPEAGKVLAYQIEQVEHIHSHITDLLEELRDIAAEWSGEPYYHQAGPSFAHYPDVTFGDNPNKETTTITTSVPLDGSAVKINGELMAQIGKSTRRPDGFWDTEVWRDT